MLTAVYEWGTKPHESLTAVSALVCVLSQRSTKNMKPNEIIEHLGLVPLPGEGGLFRQSYLACDSVPQACLPGRYGSDKPFSTAIYYLLTAEPDSFSALHRLPTDEVYHFYLGDPVEMLMLFPDSRSEEVVLGQDILGGQKVQHVVPKEVWQGSRVIAGGRFALMGTAMAPGFTESDYEGGRADELCKRYPEQAELIRQLTRS
jgi:predicted cupin superfamily sugar epimerase